MTPEEEKIRKLRENLGEYYMASKKDLNARLESINELSSAGGNIINALQKLSESNKKQFLEYRSNYHENFERQMNNKKEAKEQLLFAFESIRDLESKIDDAKMDNHRFNIQCYESVLNGLVIPVKNQLVEIVRLENEVGKLRKEETIVPPMKEEIPVNDKGGFYSPRKIITGYDQEPEEIPVTIIDKPLETKTGKQLNNVDYITKGRKFNWTDDRIPDLIADFLLEKGCIFEHQSDIVRIFLKTTRCNSKITFDGNANQLTTMLYELTSTKHLQVFKNFLGERVEAVFVKKGDTLKPLVSCKTLSSDFRPNNIDRRTKPGSPYYLDILTYIDQHLKGKELVTDPGK